MRTRAKRQVAASDRARRPNVPGHILFYNIYRPRYLYSSAKCGKMGWCVYWLPDHGGMKGERRLKIRIRRILFPILFCLAVACLIELPLAQTTLFGDDVILWDTLFRAIIAVPMLVHLYKEDAVFRGEEHWNGKVAAAVALGGAGISLLFGLAVKTFQIPGAQLADESLFTGNLWLEVVVLLAASPILEEYFFRGVLYGRCKELMPAPAAALLTAAFFGVFHWDLVQGVYSFMMGLILAYLMEKTNTVKAPVVFHFAANLAALVLAAF